MANAFDKYGKTKAQFLESGKAKAIGAFNDTSGGGASVDPFGDNAAKKKDGMNMNAASAFEKKNLTNVETMGVDAGKSAKKQVEEHYNGEHFDQSVQNYDIAPGGTEAGKTKSGQSDR